MTWGVFLWTRANKKGINLGTDYMHGWLCSTISIPSPWLFALSPIHLCCACHSLVSVCQGWKGLARCAYAPFVFCGALNMLSCCVILLARPRSSSQIIESKTGNHHPLKLVISELSRFFFRSFLFSKGCIATFLSIRGQETDWYAQPQLCWCAPNEKFKRLAKPHESNHNIFFHIHETHVISLYLLLFVHNVQTINSLKIPTPLFQPTRDRSGKQ